MSLQLAAQHLASKGRDGDSVLVHMTPGEVRGLQELAMANGGELTINPETGLPEANFLKALLPTIIGAALAPLTAGTSLAFLGTPLGAGLAVGGVEALRTGDLGKGLMAGFGAYGGANLAGALTNVGGAGLQAAAAAPSVEAIKALDAAAAQGMAFPVDVEATKLLQQQVAEKTASLTPYDKLMAGASSLGSEAGRSALVNALGGPAGAVRTAAGIAGPIAAAQDMQSRMPKTVTQMTSPTARITPYEIDEYGNLRRAGSYTPQEFVDRGGFASLYGGAPPGAAGGGLMSHLADGGTPYDEDFAFSQRSEPVMRMANGGATLTPDIARDLMYRSMTTGAPTSEFDKYGGYGAVSSMYQRMGGQFNRSEIPAADLQKYANQVASSGVGNLAILKDTNTPIGLSALLAMQQNEIDPDLINRAASEYQFKGLTPSQFKQHIYQGGADDVLATQRGVEYARAAGLTPQQTLDIWNQGLGTNFGMSDYERVMKQFPAVAPVDPSKPAIISRTAPTGYDYSAAQLQNDRQRQINDIYNRVLNRQAEQSGLDYWTNSGLSISEIEAQIKQIAKDIGVAAPKPQATLGEPFQPTPDTVADITKKYEQGGGATRMPTITDIKPTDRMYSQGQAVELVRGYLKSNPNAMYRDVVAFANSRGIPEMQARAAYNEFRFTDMSPGMQGIYDYLMGRGPAPIKPYVPGGGPIMRSYREVMGIPSTYQDLKPVNFTSNQGAVAGGVPKEVPSVKDPSGKQYPDLAAFYFNANPDVKQAYESDPQARTMTPEDYVAFHWNNFGQKENRSGYYEQLAAKPATYEGGGGASGGVAQDIPNMARGGLSSLAILGGAAGGGQFDLGSYSDGGRLLRGPGDGVSDSIPATIGGKRPARLADGEFVVPARIVSELGNGSTEAGARKLYAMMDRVQRARSKSMGKGKVAKNTRADKYLPA